MKMICYPCNILLSSVCYLFAIQFFCYLCHPFWVNLGKAAKNMKKMLEQATVNHSSNKSPYFLVLYHTQIPNCQTANEMKYILDLIL